MSAWVEGESPSGTWSRPKTMVDKHFEPEVNGEKRQLDATAQAVRALARSLALNQRIADDELVARFRNGESAAFNELASKYQGRLMRVVSRLIHNKADAEDVVQEALLRAYRAMPNFRGDSAFYTWLFAISINTAKNFKTIQKKKACLSVCPIIGLDDSDYEAPVAIDLDTPLARLEQKQMIVALDAAVDAMPEYLSVPLILCQLEGMSYDDIAQTMSCPVGTVRSRIYRARELLAHQMAPFLNPQPSGGSPRERSLARSRVS